MNKNLVLIFGILMITAQRVLCATEAVNADLEQSLKSQSSEPSMFYIFFALIFVICLIYVTGIIYSKLNIVGAKAVQDQIKKCDIDRAVVISTTQLGQGKNLHVIEINKKRYLIGATPESIHLIKELGLKNENEEEEKIEEPVEDEIDEAISVLYGGAEEEEIVAEEFNVHKKYL